MKAIHSRILEKHHVKACLEGILKKLEPAKMKRVQRFHVKSPPNRSVRHCHHRPASIGTHAAPSAPARSTPPPIATTFQSLPRHRPHRGTRRSPRWRPMRGPSPRPPSSLASASSVRPTPPTQSVAAGPSTSPLALFFLQEKQLRHCRGR
jgi:hypothetical protein